MTTSTTWVFLSHKWGPACPSYGNGSRIKLSMNKCMIKGDSCNTITFEASNHIGTHFDFPRHFDRHGPSVDDFPAESYVYNHVDCLWLNVVAPGCLLDLTTIKSALKRQPIPIKIELLLMRTGSGLWREQDSYWQDGIGIGKGVADYLRECFPHLRAVGLDTISISSLRYREIGREVHREFLIGDGKRRLLIIEDMMLEPLRDRRVGQVIALPLRIDEGDGAPCTVIAQVDV